MGTVVLVRKYLVITASTFSYLISTSFRCAWGTYTALHLHDENSPFGEQELHRIEMLSLLLLTLVLWSGLYFFRHHLYDTSQRMVRDAGARCHLQQHRVHNSRDQKVVYCIGAPEITFEKSLEEVLKMTVVLCPAAGQRC